MEKKDEELLNTDWGLGDLHKSLLKILEYVNNICEEKHINYCLAYGTALGSKRHSGFIPWDDDVDIYMPLKDYIAFRNYFNNEGDHENYYLQELGGIDGYVTVAKLRLNGTTFIESIYQDYDMHHGIYIDIFVLFDAPVSIFKKRKMLIANQYLLLKSLSNRRYKRNRKFLLLLMLLRLLPKNFLRLKALKYLSTIGDEESGEFFDVDMRVYDRSFYSKDLLFPAKLVDFSGIRVYGPARIDDYLRLAYGDYMSLPNIEEIKRAQHTSTWCVDKDFRTLTKVTDSFADEKGWKG